jgi:hypothetical protein
VSDSIIDREVLQPMYYRLLEQARTIKLRDESGLVLCSRCKQCKSQHLGDGRCDIHLLSGEFHSEDSSRLERIWRAMVLIEELREL